MTLIELSDYSLAAVGSGTGIRSFSFKISPGEVCAIECSNQDDANTFLRALATLTRPLEGTYRFHGRICRPDDYHALLQCKQRIGYVAADAALISNMTLRQNLLLQRHYHEDRLDIDLDNRTLDLCRTFDIHGKLERRPAELGAMEVQAAIMIREATKKPDVLLLNQPVDFIGNARFGLLVQLFEQWAAERMPIVFISGDQRLVTQFANRKIRIAHGTVTPLTVNALSGLE